MSDLCAQQKALMCNDNNNNNIVNGKQQYKMPTYTRETSELTTATATVTRQQKTAQVRVIKTDH